MSSCCSNEIIFSSVVNEITSSNLELFSNIFNVVNGYWLYLGATAIGIIVLALTRQFSGGLSRPC